MNMLEVRELCLHYKQSQILFDVSLSVERGAALRAPTFLMDEKFKINLHMC